METEKPRILCIAVHAYQATNTDQLTMAAYEQLEVIEEQLPGGWTLVKNSLQIQGKVPTGYLKIALAQSPVQAPAPPHEAAVAAPTLLHEAAAPTAPPSPLQAPQPPAPEKRIQRLSCT